jgi:hypothetical protein
MKKNRIKIIVPLAIAAIWILSNSPVKTGQQKDAAKIIPPAAAIQTATEATGAANEILPADLMIKIFTHI